MKNGLIFFFLLSILAPLSAQDMPAYVLYDQDGKKVKYSKMLKAIAESDVLLFGEIHNNPICHWLQLEVSQEMLDRKKGKLIMGAEMFERDNQLLIDEYFSGSISEKYFEDECRLWENYQTDYKPLLDLAKAHQLKLVATNIPRRYANTVFKQGIEALDQLSEEAKRYIAPLPIEIDLNLQSYQSMMEMMGGHTDKNENFPKAQAIKDATMAWFIAQHLQPDHSFLHFNGSFHSDNYEGINWYLKKYKPGLKIITISTVSQAKINQLEKENKNKADYILCTPETMCNTHF